MDSHLSSHDSGIYPLYNPKQRPEDKHAAIRTRPRVYSLAALLLLSAAGYLFLYSIPAVSAYFTIDIIANFPDKFSYAGFGILSVKLLAILASLYMTYYIYNIRPDLPVGRSTNSQDFPELFKLINEVCAHYDYKEMLEIKITRHFEINTIKTPKNGFIYGFKNTLMIGLPLMQSISSDQLELAISREIFKLSGFHKRPSSFITYTLNNWQQLNTTNQLQAHATRTLFSLFISWHTLTYDFLSKPIRRQEELSADSHIHNIYTDQSFIELLLTLLISNNYLHQSFWPLLYSTAYKYDKPPYLPYASIERHLQTNIDKKQSRSWINIALKSHEDDPSNISLKIRLANLSHDEIKTPAPVKLTAATSLLGLKLDEIIQAMDKLWLYRHQDEWSRKYQQGLIERNKLKELAIQARHGLLSDIKAWEYIQLIKLYIDKEKAIALYQQILKINTRDPRISFDIGRSLLESMVESGIPALEKTIRLDNSYSVSCYQLITRYYTRMGNTKLAQAYRRKTLVHQLEVA